MTALDIVICSRDEQIRFTRGNRLSRLACCGGHGVANNHGMLSAAPSTLTVPRNLALLLVLATAPLHVLAAPAEAPVASPTPLNLRLPRPGAQTVALPAPERQRPALRLEPRKSFIEQGIEGSREALIACQNGAYPGATVAAHGVQVSGGDSQPGHCYRF